MNHEKIDRMKQEYEQIEVPEALKTQVEAGIRKGKRETQKEEVYEARPLGEPVLELEALTGPRCPVTVHHRAVSV